MSVNAHRIRRGAEVARIIQCLAEKSLLCVIAFNHIRIFSPQLQELRSYLSVPVIVFIFECRVSRGNSEQVPQSSLAETNRTVNDATKLGEGREGVSAVPAFSSVI